MALLPVTLTHEMQERQGQHRMPHVLRATMTLPDPRLNGFTDSSWKTRGKRLLRKLTLRQLTIWSGKFESFQSIVYALLWLSLMTILVVQYEDWKQDLEQENWIRCQIPLIEFVFNQGRCFTLFFCAAGGIANVGLAFVGSRLVYAAEKKCQEEILIWLKISSLMFIIQFINKLVFALNRLDGPYVSAFLWIQILFRLSTIGIAKNYYDILVYIREAMACTFSQEHLITDDDFPYQI